MDKPNQSFIALHMTESILIRVAKTALLATVSVLLLVACGGENEEEGSSLLGVGSGPEQSPVPTVEPIPTSTPQATSTPAPATPTPDPTPTPAPTPTPLPGELFAPTLSASGDGGTLSVTWDDTNGDSYRILIWALSQGIGVPPVESETTSREYLSTAAAGDYRVMVEAYDDMGNSVFSAPTYVEVTP